MHKEYERFRRFDTAKRIGLVLFTLYIVVVLKSPESRDALPGLKQCFDFYLELFRALSEL